MIFRFCAALALAAITPAVLRAQVSAGEEFIVSSGANSPSLAADAAGNFVVVFYTSDRDGDLGGVAARRYDASGAPAGPDFQVNTYTTGCQGNAYGIDVASDPAGNFTVVWMSLGCFDRPSQDGSDSGVYGQRYDALGQPRGPEFRINTFTTGGQHFPTVAAGASGNMVVVWQDSGRGGQEVFGQRFDASGAPVGGEFQVDAPGAGSSYLPDVATDAEGNFVVVWYNLENFATRVWGRRFTASGTPAGPEFRIDDPAPGIDPSVPVVAMNPQGGFVVSWSSTDPNGLHDVRARVFDATGAPLGPQLTVATGTTWPSSVATDASGNFLVAWTRGSFVDPERVYALARRFDASGTPRGGEFLIGPDDPRQYREKPRPATDASGNVVVASLAFQTIVARRFGGLVPGRAVADVVPSGSSDGNGVLESGEAVQILPAWRNVNGQTQTFDGRALGLTGPAAAGVSYVLGDDAAAYGTVANGTTAPCTDCYSIGVTASGSRPATHWDAQLSERITPDALGQSRIWPLHIGESFTDVPRTSPFYRSVETTLHKGVTIGCRPGEFCPADAVTREQMAVFALVGRYGPSYLPSACGTPVFADVPAASPYCRFIEDLARRGIAGGCRPGQFCPGEPLTREQAAVFLLRTLDPSLQPQACAAPNMFTDVPEDSPFCRWIEELARRGFASGCGGGRFCPERPTTREQMAALTSQTFGLSLY